MIANLQPYPEYKESGLLWLGKVPGHWQVQRLKNWVAINRLTLGEETPPEYAFEYLDIGAVSTGRLAKRPSQMRFADAPSRARRVLQPGDTIVSTVRTYLRAVYTVGDTAGQLVASTGFAVLSPRADTSPRCLGYVAQSEAFTRQVTAESVGIAYPAISETRLGNIAVTLPPSAEQTAIVRFLDWASGRLERAIRAKRKVIALLGEQKQAIIHRAVTRGLDPAVPLKPSGIPWVGEIPAHWEVRQLRRLVKPGRRITYGIVQPGEPDANGRFMIRGQDYSRGWARAEEIFRVSPSIEVPYSRSRLAAGDLVLTIVGAGVGNVAVVPEWLDGANITQTTARVSLDPSKAHPAYVALVLQGPIGKQNVERYVKGAAQPGLNLEHVRVFLLPSPPLSEQIRIVEATAGQLAEFDEASNRLEREVDLLREYRTRLVADVVTGKLDVRETASRLLCEAPLDTAADDTGLTDEPDIADDEAEE